MASNLVIHTAKHKKDTSKSMYKKAKKSTLHQQRPVYQQREREVRLLCVAFLDNISRLLLATARALALGCGLSGLRRRRLALLRRGLLIVGLLRFGLFLIIIDGVHFGAEVLSFITICFLLNTSLDPCAYTIARNRESTFFEAAFFAAGAFLLRALGLGFSSASSSSPSSSTTGFCFMVSPGPDS